MKTPQGRRRERVMDVAPRTQREKRDVSKSVQRVEVRNVNVPGYASRVRKDMYDCMRNALMKVLPQKSPGLTQAEMFKAVLPHLSAHLFPGGAKASWWAKTVQLDLEARGVILREKKKLLRWRKK